MASITSRQFNHDVGSAKRAALVEPVIITDRGEPKFVLMTYEDYRRRPAGFRSLVDALRGDFDDDIELELPERELPDESRIPDFSGDDFR